MNLISITKIKPQDVQPLKPKERLSWMTLNPSKSLILALGIMIQLFQEPSTSLPQLMHSLNLQESLWIKMKKLQVQLNIIMKRSTSSMQLLSFQALKLLLKMSSMQLTLRLQLLVSMILRTVLLNPDAQYQKFQRKKGLTSRNIKKLLVLDSII